MKDSACGFTDKQYKILIVLCHGNGKDENGKFVPCDIDELLERLAYRTTKQSMQFSIRALVKHRLIVKDKEKRRGAKRVILVPTTTAMKIMGYYDPSYLEGAEDSEELDLSHLDI